MSHPIACVSSCMLPVACVATHGRTHALLHASFTFPVTPPRPHSSQHVWGLCAATHGPLHVGSHAQISVTETPRASVKWLTPRPDPLDQATSSFSVDLRDFGPSGEFFVPRSIPNIFPFPI
ncbi:hypothetical protein DY000_02041431 [Brassica cretica]|uniref:Secreted protein n=1 Tax=Brassica cretica TaxID=69181 RepID=A0ABQ7BMA8_BRACR|nr:hypothetical protein DY000_02041431 [Brassica cretica]